MNNLLDTYKVYTEEVNKIKEQKKKLNLKLNELKDKFLETLGYKHGDLLQFTEEYNKKHHSVDNWRFYLIGIAQEKDSIKLVCSFKPPKSKQLSTGGMWLNIDDVEKYKENT